jgi:hypothetical protein
MRNGILFAEYKPENNLLKQRSVQRAGKVGTQ